MRIKLEHIIFWVLILAAIGVAVWLLVGSPSIEQGLLMITIFVATSEVLLWKAFFTRDKKTAIGFEKIDKKTALSFNQVRNQLENIQKDIKEIKSLVK